MKLLMDGPARRLLEAKGKYDFIAGQLISPPTHRAWFGDPYAIDNGAFAGFDAERFMAILKRQKHDGYNQCLFVACPDVVGSARRTLEVFDYWFPRLEGWPVALVAQDGLEDLAIPWHLIDSVFIGGSTTWKLSQAAADIVKTGKILGKHVHAGRVNTPERYRHFRDLGADTFDGSGVSRFTWMLDAIQAGQFVDRPLLNEAAEAAKEED